MSERLAIASLKANARRNIPPNEIMIAKGMKVSKADRAKQEPKMTPLFQIMVTLNIETEMDVANGTRGEIVDIILDLEEDPITPGERKVHLRKPPAYVLVKLPHTRMQQLPGLPPNIVPIKPMSERFSITLTNVDKTTYVKQVKRKQLPITAAYAFTDYRAQGQTIKNVIVDIAKPPWGTLTIFNLYVELSRSSGRDTIRLLRDFPNELFRKPLPEELVDEDYRLRVLNEKTKTEYARGMYK